MADTWQTAELVFITLPACPACGSPSYLTIRSEANGDGSTTRKAICRDCSSRFKIVAELPDFGRAELGGWNNENAPPQHRS